MPKSVAEKRADSARRAREYRDRQRRARDSVTRDARDVRDAAAPRTMRDAVESALLAMKWLMPSDDASVAQARMLAEDVDLLRHAGETTKVLSAQRALTAVLNDLGGTPTVRMQHELRSLRVAGKAAEVPHDDSGSEGARASNVSTFTRPPKRNRTG